MTAAKTKAPLSLRERLEAKARRRVTLPVQVGDDPTPAVQLVEGATFALAVARGAETVDEAAVATAEEALAAAQAGLAEHWVHVEFVALDPDDMERLLAAHQGADGELDTDSAVPYLAAECAVDESLGDPQWWADHITAKWSYGERTQFTSDLFNLNYSAPSRNVPKG